MPQVTDGGTNPQPLVGFHSVASNPLVGGGSTEVIVQSGSVQQAVDQASVAIKQIATAADPGNLPTNAIPGQLYSFTSQPDTLYFQGADGVWRALLSVAVT